MLACHRRSSFCLVVSLFTGLVTICLPVAAHQVLFAIISASHLLCSSGNNAPVHPRSLNAGPSPSTCPSAAGKYNIHGAHVENQLLFRALYPNCSESTRNSVLMLSDLLGTRVRGR